MWNAMPSPDDAARALTREDFDAAVKAMGEQKLQPSMLIVSPRDAIDVDVVTRPGTHVTVRKPVRARMRDAWRWVEFYKRNRHEMYDRPTLRDTAEWIAREMRRSTHNVLTDEARREIQWRHAEMDAARR